MLPGGSGHMALTNPNEDPLPQALPQSGPDKVAYKQGPVSGKGQEAVRDTYAQSPY